MARQIVKFESGFCKCGCASGKHEVGGGRCKVVGCNCKKYKKVA